MLCSGYLSFERTNEKKQEMQRCLVRFFLLAEGCSAGQQEVQLTFQCLEGIPALLTQHGGGLASPFLLFHIHAFSWHQDQFRSEFSPLLPPNSSLPIPRDIVSSKKGKLWLYFGLQYLLLLLHLRHQHLDLHPCLFFLLVTELM